MAYLVCQRHSTSGVEKMSRKEFAEHVIESFKRTGYRPRQVDEVGIFRVKELTKDLRDDALTVINPKVDTAEAQRVKQYLSKTISTHPDYW